MNAPVDPAPPFGQPKAVPRIIAGRDQLFVTTLPYARSDIKAAVPIWLWPLLKPFIEALLAAFFKSLFSAKAEFAARGVGIAIEGE